MTDPVDLTELRLRAERDALRAENVRLREALTEACDRLVQIGTTLTGVSVGALAVAVDRLESLAAVECWADEPSATCLCDPCQDRSALARIRALVTPEGEA